jgi:eukaryotic-like serine/threonine-protein kinase
MNAGLPQQPTPVLGRYRLLMELGRGGMAHVYLALVSGLAGFSKLVVLKVMRDELREHPASLNMFLGEARLAARMHHPHVVQTSEVGEDGGRYFICMEYLEGYTLSRLLKNTLDGSLPLAARLEIICQMLEGVAYLHAFSDLDGTPLDLVHRDISPNNIFITFDGGVKVLDFGVAKAAGISHVTESGTFKGKLGYAAPEQIFGRSDQRSDVFAAGVLLWEILTYRRLTQDRTQTEIVQGRIAGAESELMLEKGGDVAPELMAICAKAAAKAPEDRYATASAMREALRGYIEQNGLDYPSQKLRDLLQSQFDAERSETRRQIDQRIKQVQLEDENSAEYGRASLVPSAAPASASSSSGASGSHAPLATSIPPAARGKLLAAAALLALIAGFAGAFVMRLSPKPTGTSGAVAAGSRGSAPAASAPSPTLVRLRLSATPANAELVLDGAKLSGNPFAGQIAKDQALHRLEVSAPGRRSDVRMIPFDEDLELRVELAPAPSAAPVVVPNAGKAASRKSEPSADSQASDFVHKSPSSKPARPIDNADPYAP